MSTHSDKHVSPMDWQATLASFGIVIGAALFVYLMCRWCRSMDLINHDDDRDEVPSRIYSRAGLWRVRHQVRDREVPYVAPIVIPPSAEAEAQYYSNYRTMENV